MKFVVLTIVLIALILTSFFVVVDIMPPKIVPILMYNKVAMGEEENREYTSPRNFEYQLKYLWKNKIKVISFKELVSYYKKNELPPERSIVITFNSGYHNFYETAYPLLSKYKFPATVFLVSDKIDTPGYLKKKHILEMHRKGLITFGSMGKTGRILTTLPQQEVYVEIFSSKQAIEQIMDLEMKIEYFAYPDGQYTKQAMHIVKESRYKAACTTNPGRRYPDKNLFGLKRTHMSNKDANVWSMKLKSWGNFVIVQEWIREKIKQYKK